MVMQRLYLIFIVIFTILAVVGVPPIAGGSYSDKPNSIMFSNRRLDAERRYTNSPLLYLRPFLRPASMAMKRPNIPKPSVLNSPLVRLPIQFLSNAKPVEVIKGITKFPPFKKPLSPSKIFYLPLKFVSNAKPYKAYLLGRR